jgi:hypothetical protein
MLEPLHPHGVRAFLKLVELLSTASQWHESAGSVLVQQNEVDLASQEVTGDLDVDVVLGFLLNTMPVDEDVVLNSVPPLLSANLLD